MDTDQQCFIDEDYIWKVIEQESAPSPEKVNAVLDKAEEGKGLDLAETAVLLAPMPEKQLDRLYRTAFALKEAIYGNRMVLFAPLYISNLCANRCAYCAFSVQNAELERRSLTSEEIIREVGILQKMGHKRVMAVYGEHPKWNAEAIARSIADIYSVKTPPSGEIRRANVNCAPLDVEGFAVLKQVGIGTYQCFQETYHRATYGQVHLGGKKKDYLWRLNALHRAQRAGVDDVGLGVLFGLFDHRFEVLALLQHAQELEKAFGVGPHTISFPRMEPAQNSDLSLNPPNAITDPVFKRIIAAVRLAVPYTGMIITTREAPDIKRELLRLGISQLSAGSRTYPGAYADSLTNRPERQQFRVGDERGLAEIIMDLQNQGYMPSFCTSCYRLGRTGDHFMGFAKKAFIHNYCEPNALATYAEYLHDYATDELEKSGLDFIESQINAMPEARRKTIRERQALIAGGQRDLCV